MSFDENDLRAIERDRDLPPERDEADEAAEPDETEVERRLYNAGFRDATAGLEPRRPGSLPYMSGYNDRGEEGRA